MKRMNRTAAMLLCLLLALLCLSGCAKEEDVEPTIPKWEFLREKTEYIVQPLVEEDFPLLEECVNLEYLDASGTECYELLMQYIRSHPQVAVVYTAPLGNLTLSNLETAAALEPGTYSYDELVHQLRYLPGIAALELPRTTMTLQEIQDFRSVYPNIEVTCTVELMGKEYAPDTTELDLSFLTDAQVEEICAQLPMLPQLNAIELMKADGTSELSMASVKMLMDALPGAKIHYTFDLFGQTLSTETESAEYEDVAIGNQGEAQIRAALDIMPNCTYLRLEDCGLDNEVLASIRADYPNTMVAWRIYFGEYTTMTDDDTLRAVYNVYDSHADVLKYCTEVKYIDMGHNTSLSDISFLAYMPKLEILILSGSSIKNLDPLANCKNLEWLEVAYCYQLEDISAVAGCESLRFFNISFTKVSDLSALTDLPLERFICLDPKAPHDVRTEVEAQHPDCWIRFTGQNPYSLGWRYNDIGETRFEYYEHIREVFDLDAVDARLAQQAAAEAATATEAPEDIPDVESSGGDEDE